MGVVTNRDEHQMVIQIRDPPTIAEVTTLLTLSEVHPFKVEAIPRLEGNDFIREDHLGTLSNDGI